MEVFYPEIRNVHYTAVLGSGLLLLLRGLAYNLMGMRWALAGSLRYLSWTIDTILLTAALMLTTIIRQFPFINGWLTVKLMLLVPYLVLGYFALYAPRRQSRLISLAGAAASFGCIYSVARAHNPLGFLA